MTTTREWISLRFQAKEQISSALSLSLSLSLSRSLSLECVDPAVRLGASTTYYYTYSGPLYQAYHKDLCVWLVVAQTLPPRTKRQTSTELFIWGPILGASLPPNTSVAIHVNVWQNPIRLPIHPHDCCLPGQLRRSSMTLVERDHAAFPVAF